MRFLNYFVLLIILASLVGLLFVSCKPTAPVQHTIHRTDTIIERERMVPITIESTSVQKTFSKPQVDSIIAALKAMPSGSKTVYYTDPKFKTQLSFALDSIGNLVVQCKTLEALYWEKLKEKDRIIERKEYELREQARTFGQKLSGFLNNGLWFVIIAIIGTAGINMLISRRR